VVDSVAGALAGFGDRVVTLGVAEDGLVKLRLQALEGQEGEVVGAGPVGAAEPGECGAEVVGALDHNAGFAAGLGAAAEVAGGGSGRRHRTSLTPRALDCNAPGVTNGRW